MGRYIFLTFAIFLPFFLPSLLLFFSSIFITSLLFTERETGKGWTEMTVRMLVRIQICLHQMAITMEVRIQISPKLYTCSNCYHVKTQRKKERARVWALDEVQFPVNLFTFHPTLTTLIFVSWKAYKDHWADAHTHHHGMA